MSWHAVLTHIFCTHSFNGVCENRKAKCQSMDWTDASDGFNLTVLQRFFSHCVTVSRKHCGTEALTALLCTVLAASYDSNDYSWTRLLFASHRFFWRQYGILGIARFLCYGGDGRKWVMGEWCYLPLTGAILTRQAVQSVKEQMRDWNRANALNCTASCSTASPDWSPFCFRALIHWLIDAFKPSRSLWALFPTSSVTDVQEGRAVPEVDRWNFWQ